MSAEQWTADEIERIKQRGDNTPFGPYDHKLPPMVMHCRTLTRAEAEVMFQPAPDKALERKK